MQQQQQMQQPQQPHAGHLQRLPMQQLNGEQMMAVHNKLAQAANRKAQIQPEVVQNLSIPITAEPSPVKAQLSPAKPQQLETPTLIDLTESSDSLFVPEASPVDSNLSRETSPINFEELFGPEPDESTQTEVAETQDTPIPSGQSQVAKTQDVPTTDGNTKDVATVNGTETIAANVDNSSASPRVSPAESDEEELDRALRAELKKLDSQNMIHDSQLCREKAYIPSFEAWRAAHPLPDWEQQAPSLQSSPGTATDSSPATPQPSDAVQEIDQEDLRLLFGDALINDKDRIISSMELPKDCHY